MGKLALVFIALPFAELLTLVRLAHAIGGFPTLLIVLGSGVIGALIARAEGLRVLAQTRQAFASGIVPSHDVLNEVLILIAAVLLIVPGVITDVIALALLLPPSRRFIGARLMASVERAIEEGKLRVASQVRAAQWRPPSQPDRGSIIDTEGETIEATVVEPEDPKRLNS